MAYIDVDFNADIATILEGLEANATKAHMMRDEIKKLKVDIAPEQKEELDSKNYQLRETPEEQIVQDKKAVLLRSSDESPRRIHDAGQISCR